MLGSYGVVTPFGQTPCGLRNHAFVVPREYAKQAFHLYDVITDDGLKRLREMAIYEVFLRRALTHLDVPMRPVPIEQLPLFQSRLIQGSEHRCFTDLYAMEQCGELLPVDLRQLVSSRLCSKAMRFLSPFSTGVTRR